jgi:hypothetical protein
VLVGQEDFIYWVVQSEILKTSNERFVSASSRLSLLAFVGLSSEKSAGGPRFILFFVVNGNVRPDGATLAFYCTPMPRGWPTLCGFFLQRVGHSALPASALLD